MHNLTNLFDLNSANQWGMTYIINDFISVSPFKHHKVWCLVNSIHMSIYLVHMTKIMCKIGLFHFKSIINALCFSMPVSCHNHCNCRCRNLNQLKTVKDICILFNIQICL